MRVSLTFLTSKFAQLSLLALISLVPLVTLRFRPHALRCFLVLP